jgi:hypothetical protein
LFATVDPGLNFELIPGLADISWIDRARVSAIDVVDISSVAFSLVRSCDIVLAIALLLQAALFQTRLRRIARRNAGTVLEIRAAVPRFFRFGIAPRGDRRSGSDKLAAL